MPNETLDAPAAPPPESPEVQAAHKEALWDEAKRLMAEGRPWQALVKKSEAIGLKPLQGFTSMAKQEFAVRRDLSELGFPLSDSHRGKFTARATGLLFPSEEGGATLHASIIEAAKRTTGARTTSEDQARQSLHEISKKAFELQAQEAFDEVGHYTIHAGYAAARAGNGDLLIADANPERLRELEEAGYTPGEKVGVTIGVPFSADVETRKDVRWGIGQTEANEPLSIR